METDCDEKGQEEPSAEGIPFLPRLKAGGLLVCFYDSLFLGLSIWHHERFCLFADNESLGLPNDLRPFDAASLQIDRVMEGGISRIRALPQIFSGTRIDDAAGVRPLD
jgi:hypothetical protein